MSFLFKEIPEALKIPGIQTELAKKRYSPEIFKDLYTKSRIFICDLSTKNVVETETGILNLPFKTCYFEVTGLPTKVGVIVNEIEPGQYEYVYIYKEGLNIGITYVSDTQFFSEKDKEFNSLVRHMISCCLYELKNSKLCAEIINERQKIKMNGQKYIHKIREVIHIIPKNTNSIKKVYEHSEIDWSHRWEVRGHWRKIKGIGKDRTGQYGVQDLTWIVPYEKGPENKPLVKKIRVI